MIPEQPQRLVPGNTLTSPDDAVAGGADAAFARTWAVGQVDPSASGAAREGAAGGQLAGRFVIESVIGEGGMGIVYLAQDALLERWVAIKVLRRERLRADGSGGAARLLREARAMARLSHPNVVTVHELGAIGQELFIAMEYVENSTLRVWQARAAGWRDIVGAYLQAGQGLAAAHRAGLVHRDFKPENVLIGHDGRPRVSDFGLVSAARADAGAEDGEPAPDPLSASLTRTGSAMGTPAYMAPEQHRREAVDARADQFSFCVALFEALYRERPFAGATYAELVEQVLAGEVRAPADRRDVPPALHQVLLRGLSVDPSKRFGSMTELLAAIESSMRDPATPTRARPRSRVVLGAGLLGTMGVAGLGVFLLRSPSEERGLRTAPREPVASVGPPAKAPLPPAVPRQLTQLGGCAYMPAFADKDTVVLDLTLGTEEHLWSVPLEGGRPVQLTTGATSEWRPMPGRRPGEIAYVFEDPSSNSGAGAGFATLDLSIRRSQRLGDRDAESVGFIGGVLHYIPRGGQELRRVRDGVDEVAFSYPAEVHANLFTVSHDGSRVAVMAKGPGTPRVCVSDPTDKHFECLSPRRMGPGHPAFSLDDASVYYPGYEGIGRVGVDGKGDTLVLPGVYALGGIALSPDGMHLVYSDCSAHGVVSDLSEQPARPLTRPGRVGDVTAGPGGSIAYAMATDDGYALMLRAPDGTTREIVGPLDQRFAYPRFSPDGSQIAFSVGGSGIHTVQILAGEPSTPSTVTTDASDDSPIWLKDGRLAFTRTGDQPGVYVTDLDGGKPVLVASLGRALGTLPDGKLLFANADVNRLFEWDPVSKRTRPAPIDAAKVGIIVGASTSTDGHWLAVRGGPTGLRLYRFDLSRPRAEPELAYEVAAGLSLNGIGITESGHVLAAPMSWDGELYALDAAPGTPF